MNKQAKNDRGLLFNIIVLGTSLFGLFLIIFLKLMASKEYPQSLFQEDLPKSRVKVSNKKNKDIQGLNGRESKILECIEEKGSLTPKEIYSLFPNFSSRTLRRDMDSLVARKFVKQSGVTKSTKYIYIGG